MRIRTPSPAMVVALLALAVALSGTAYAAVTINGSQIQNGTITANKLRNGTITANKLRKHTLTGNQINAGSLRGVASAKFASRASTAQNARFASRANTAENAKSASSAATAQTATTALSATSAQTAQTAQTATTADTATTAANATELGGQPASNYVAGGGTNFQTAYDQPLGITSDYSVNGLGTFQVGCAYSPYVSMTPTVTLFNTTGSTVETSYSWVSNGGSSSTGFGDAEVTAGGPIVNIGGGPNSPNLVFSTPGQVHYMLDWAPGSPTHFADFTVSTFQVPAATGSSTPGSCGIQIAGTVR